MSNDSPHSSSRAQALRAARQRLQWLEVETHRMKAQLARLEADFEDGVADELTDDVEQLATLPNTSASVGEVPPADFEFRNSSMDLAAPIAAPNGSNWPAIVEQPADPLPESLVHVTANKPAGPFAQARSLIASFGIHIAVLLVLLPLTYATFVRSKEPPAPQASVTLNETPTSIDEVELNGTAIDGIETEPTMFGDAKGDLAEHLLNGLNVEPDSAAASVPDPMVGPPAVAIGDVGTLTTDGLTGGGGNGTGNGADAGSGAAGRGSGTGSADFFGAQSRGDRFVFVVDDSSSMKDGRLEAAVAEIARSIEAMSRRQSFYVIFVSDKPYPMFYPNRATDLLPATPENKKLLAQWLGKVRLASGKNRELINAMDMAAALRPHAVFLLWDGDLRYSEAVRNDVMKHLAGPQLWNFAVHTIGMGTLSPESEQNLVTIAKARRGTFRRVDVAKTPTK